VAIATDVMQLQTPVSGNAAAATANANRDGSGTVELLHTAGANGARFDLFRAVAKGTTTAGMVRFYLSTDTGTTKRLLKELIVAAVTVAADVPGWDGEWRPTVPLVIPAGAKLYASTHNADAGFNVFALGGDY
jgi:hypothetical protein